MEDEKQYDYYYASGWFSPEQEKNYEMITSRLKDAGLNLFEPRYKAGELEAGPLTIERARKIFEADLNGIDSCKAVFADISFRDTGVLFELGYAKAKGLPIVIFDNSDRKVINVMLASCSETCLRNEVEINDWLNGEKVFDLGDGELQ